jgi:hypothetical protein
MATGVVHSETLTLIKRASKQPQKIRVTPVEVDGVWVKNVRVDPNSTLTTKSGTTKYVANTRPRRHLVPSPAFRGGCPDQRTGSGRSRLYYLAPVGTRPIVCVNTLRTRPRATVRGSARGTNSLGSDMRHGAGPMQVYRRTPKPPIV